MAELDKAFNILSVSRLDEVTSIMLDSGVLKPTAPAQSSVEVDRERCSALLALTACLT